MQVAPPGRIDFLGTNKRAERFRSDASYVYRCENLALALEAIGCPTQTAHIAAYDGHVDPPAAVVVHRPQYGPRLSRLLATLRKAGTKVIIDIDDLIVDPTHAAHSPAVVNGLSSWHRLWFRFWRHGKALSQADLITVSTQTLADHLRALRPGIPVHIIPNAVHMSWRDCDVAPGQSDSRKTLLYSPGTRSHDRDFELVREPVECFLDDHPEVALQLTGPLEHRLRARGDQVTHTQRVPFADYGERVRGGWLNLCPLEDSPFNRCKSALKVIEAGYWNIPTVCSPNPDCERFTKAGALIAASPDEWISALESMLDDDAYACRTDRLRERTLELADGLDQARRFLGIVETIR